jgi:hypothetical protein
MAHPLFRAEGNLAGQTTIPTESAGLKMAV